MRLWRRFWGVTVKAPTKSTHSAGAALSYSSAHNTDGIAPGEAASNGYIVCSKISTGDDHIAIKGSSATGVSRLVIAHNRFGAELEPGVVEVAQASNTPGNMAVGKALRVTSA